MLTKEQIEARKFTLYNTSEKSITNRIDNRSDYLAVAENLYKNKYLIELIYFDNGLIAVTTFYNAPIKNREYFFMGTITTEAELDIMLDRLDVALTKVDLTTLTTDWV